LRNRHYSVSVFYLSEAIKVAQRNKGIAQKNLIKANTDLHVLYALRQEKKQNDSQ